MNTHAATAAAASAAAATAIAGVPGVKVGPAALVGLSTMPFEEEVVTSPLCEPGLALGTIIEAKEGSTSGESEHGDSPEPLEPMKAPSVKKATMDSPQEFPRDRTEELIADEGAAHPDVDGGWAWVVLLSVFLIFAITSGLLYTTGLYYVQMLSEYGKSRSYTAWMGSLTNAFFMLGGPISSSFIQRFGCRSSLMLGSVLMMAGYIASAFTTSLEMLFFTYGIVIACGMNFCYSGQIIALAQYFDKRQSIATSGAMIGIGLGMFFMSSLSEYVIQEYGWRGSFLFNGALSLQIMVLGALVFPLQLTPSQEFLKDLQEQTEKFPGSIATVRGMTTSRSRVFFEKSLNDRSFSSLRLSAGASYLSHSLLSLTEPRPVVRVTTNLDPGITSNQHSFCSRGSHLAIGSLRSNGHSFCNRDSQAELSHSDLRSNQYSFPHRDSHVDFGLFSRNQSFCSRRDSQYDGDIDAARPGVFGVEKARFLLREGDCDLSCCVDELEDGCADAQQNWRNERRSLCTLLVKKLKMRTQRAIKSISENSSDHPLLDTRVWLMDFSVLFCMLGTLTLYVIYKDFADSVGQSEYYSMALSGIGIGDLCGRVSTGLLMTLKQVDAVFTYGLVMLLCSLVMIGHLFINSPATLLTLTAVFGCLYGSMNVLIAVAPSKEFGKEKLVMVFGYILFFGGIGALIGAPLAGFIVDLTGSYTGVIWFSVANLLSGAVLMFLCYLISQKMKRKRQLPGEEV
ncbi:uncharacterized protein LOC134785013 isoform X1 [Penaeus indicus]|uniref:uncharacterized protein LOC134785013 isoform X1 n=2 Tax=Penaeus indicus TaxID=29960 RepID=UPI00300CF86F